LISGFPPRNRIFFLGSRVDSDLAGIIVKESFMENSSKDKWIVG